MKDLNFTVYIGENMVQGQHKSDIAIENVIAIVYPDSPVPHGKITLDGKLYLQQTNCFWSIAQIKDYFFDWFEIVENKNRIVADIHLNIKSIHRVFRGESIVEILKRIENDSDYRLIRSFDI